MRGLVYHNGVLAGYLEKDNHRHYIFKYEDQYFENKAKPPISLSFPKNKKEYQSEHLFPFFFGLLAEGVNKEIQCRLLKIDEKDHFTRLLLTAGEATIGAITIKPEEDVLLRML
ncbi:serine/threonine-protein kinase HipA [Arachidicoccus rhizosphaerae]|uniref:Serine/threonine-protein kinase HipA n=1 Tax=Arachidicoccus rhizosphaerae TaxID=551991 RepID=A0A1H4D191_9BACT|nr:HipA N-terminal domain-containing protein [Arachidicoccus rhizosphaerae]SEA66351.1 serine/threonine-protein kinase HipA [Arachidicoccus rhizosphaerae]